MTLFRKNIFRKFVLIGLPVTLIVLLTASAYWLLYTASGAVWMWSQAEDVMDGAMHASRLDGDLNSGLFIQDLIYQSGSVDLSARRMELQAGPGLWPLSVQIRVLVLQDLQIVTRSHEVQANSQSDEADFRAVLTALNLPLPLIIQDAQISNIGLQAGDNPPVTLVESLRFQAALDDHVVVDQLNVEAPGFEAGLQGYMMLESPFELAAVVEGRVELKGASAVADWNLPFKLEGSGNLDKLQFSLVSDENGFELYGELLEPVTEPAWDIKGGLDHMQWPLDDSGEAVNLSALTLSSEGRIDDWSFVLDSGVQYGALETSLLTIAGTGSTSDIQISGAALKGPGVDLSIGGKLDWSPRIEAGLSVVIRQLDLSPWLDDWPAGGYIAGDVELNWSESGLKIPMGRLTLAGTETVVNIEADIDIEANTVDALLDWSGFIWPIKDETPDFSSPAGRLSVNGSVDQWVTTGEIEVQLGDYPQGRFEIQGGGNRTSTRLAILSGEVLGGSVSGEAGADWESDLTWDATILAQGVDPAPLLPGWPGRLDAEIEIDAQSLPERIQINLLSLQGSVRGVPLNVRGGLSIGENGLTFKRVEARTDNAVLQLNGNITDPAGASVKFSGYLPSLLLDGASGSVELEGRYSSNASNPLLDVQLEALNLTWREFGVKGLAVSTRETGETGPLPAFQLDASILTWQEVLFDELSLSLRPAGDQYRLKANLASEKIALSSTMKLAPEGTEHIFNRPWRGVLDELELTIGQAYGFKLLKPALFEWSPDAVKLGPVCMHDNDGAGLCLDSEFNHDGGWSLVADATAIPLDYLRDLLELDVHFEQMIEGHLEWHQPQAGVPTGSAKFRITPGRIFDLDENELLAESSEGKFEFVLQNGNLESGALDIEFPGTGFIDLDFDVQDITGDGARLLKGCAVAQLNDISLIGQLTLPGVDKINGSFESNIQLGGTLTDPVFEGSFSLSNGLVQYVPIGLKLEDIEIMGQLEERDRGKIEGQFRAGEGLGSIAGNFLFNDMGHIQMDVALSGDRLLLVNTDSLKILTETDLRFGLTPQRLDINGHIRVPSARLTPANLLLEKASDSEDLIIETHEGRSMPVLEENTTQNRVFGQLEVTFGDDVLVKVPGVETSISGTVLYNWSGDHVPIADGSYELQGKVDVYGPTLQIDNGNISFPEVPADNPLLNIRAGRDIYGNTQIRSAGVRLIGTLKRPVLEAYTVPATNEDRAWTLLVTGTDFDQGQGVGGFDVGTYIAPKLYVSYGISLFEDENIISARYDLKKGFGVKVTSGQRETGLDISYTIDR